MEGTGQPTVEEGWWDDATSRAGEEDRGWNDRRPTTALQPPRASNSRGYCEGVAKEAERGEVVKTTATPYLLYH